MMQLSPRILTLAACNLWRRGYYLLKVMLVLPLFLLLGACISTSAPEGVTAVSGFQLDRYLGTWFEIARLDHRFERGLRDVTADYSLNDNGSVKVVNRGTVISSGKVKDATGKASFVKSESEAHLKVSFFGPFYGAYIVFELADDYSHAVVSGPSRKFLWILARSPDLPDSTYQELVEKARKLSFPVDDLIKVIHTPE